MHNWMDLHLHTDCSADGDYTPEQLIFCCASHGLRAVAVTDHNTVRGVARARRTAEAHDLLFLSGIEIDCTCGGQNLHLLGYGIDEHCAAFQRLEQDIHAQEQAASETRMDRVEALGIPFDRDWVRAHAPQGVVTGELIAMSALMQDTPCALLAPYQAGGARADSPYVNFYWDFCAQGKPTAVPLLYPSLQQALRMVHEAGGAAVLAHPGISIGMDHPLLHTVLSYEIDGIEAYSSYHDARQGAFYRTLARQYGKIATVGSDFHGKTKPTIFLGDAACEGQGQALAALLLCIAGHRNEKGART